MWALENLIGWPFTPQLSAWANAYYEQQGAKGKPTTQAREGCGFHVGSHSISLLAGAHGVREDFYREALARHQN